MFDYILLDCIEKLKAERTMYNIYHLLQGRKSAQTLQDRNIYGLSSYYGIYRSLSRSQFEQAIQQLKEKKLITLDGDQALSATVEGYNYYLKEKEWMTDILAFNGSNYGNQAYEFGYSLQLFLQIITHMYKGHHRFIPIVEDLETQRFIKNVWKKNKGRSEELLKMIYSDLYVVLQSFPVRHAECFVDRLTTYSKIGLSNLQLAQKYNFSSHDAYLIFFNIIHYICEKIEDSHEFQFIQELYRSLPKQKELTASAQKTYDFICTGYAVEQIAEVRQLKINTILDHIIEIAYAYPGIDWSLFITDKDFQLINKVLKQLSTKKLKIIKHHLPESISYFQIKLVIALQKKMPGGE